jgi:hypothetical protein
MAVAICVVGTLEGGVVMRGRVSTLLRKGVAHVAWNRTPGAVVTAVFDPPLQRFDGRLPRVVLDGRCLRDGIRFDGVDAWPVHQDTLDDCLLGCVVQPADVEYGRSGLTVRARRGAEAMVGVTGHRYLVFANR